MGEKKEHREEIQKAIVGLEREGKLTPEAVVKAAKSMASPLHDCFEWDDSEAASRYRLWQARELIASIRIEIVVEEKELSVVRYVRDPECLSDSRQGYISLPALRNNPEDSRKALLYELARAEAYVTRAESLVSALESADAVIHSTLYKIKSDMRKLSSHIEQFASV